MTAPSTYTSRPLSAVKAPGKYALIGGPFGSKLGRGDYVDEGIPVIRGCNLPSQSRFSFDDFVFVTDDKARDLASNLAFPGDIVVTQRGTLGQVGLIPATSPYDRFVVSQSQMKLTVDCSRANPQFVYYALVSPVGQHEIKSRAITAGVPHINLSLFQQLQIPFPPLPTQRKIAAILSAYDDLIENNTRRIEILEEMAQRIYREWFVEFRYPGHEGVPLVDSELGPIPEGWEVKPLFAVAQPTFGYPFKSEQFNTSGKGKPVIRIRDLIKNQTATWTTEVTETRYEIENGDILIGMDGDFHMCRWAAGRAWLNQRVVRFRPRGNDLSRYELYLALREPVRELEQSIIGTTVAHLGKRHLEALRIIVPSEQVRQRARDIFDAHFDLEIRLRQANENLRATRDLLLPRLISGEIDVEDLNIDTSGLVS